MKTSSAFSASEPDEAPVPDQEELPIRPVRELEDVPLPKKVTRETEAASPPPHRKEDLQHGDEGIDDPPAKEN